MKTYFYEINEPYSAVIKAHNEDESLDVDDWFCNIKKEE